MLRQDDAVPEFADKWVLSGRDTILELARLPCWSFSLLPMEQYHITHLAELLGHTKSKVLEELTIRCRIPKDMVFALGDLLCRSNNIVGLRILRLESAKIGDEGVGILARALEKSPHLGGLMQLWLRGNYIGDGGITTLAGALERSPHMASLSILRLTDNQIGSVGVGALVDAIDRSPHLGGLISLCLNGNCIGNDGVAVLGAALKRSNFSRMRYLHLDDNGIEDIVPLAEAFELSEHLVWLSIDRNDIGASGAIAMANALKRSPYQKIGAVVINTDNIGERGRDAFVETFEQSPHLGINILDRCYDMDFQKRIDSAREKCIRNSSMAALFSVVAESPTIRNLFTLDYRAFTLVAPFL